MSIKILKEIKEILDEIRGGQRRWMTPVQAARYLGYHQKTIYRLIEKGKLPVIRLSDGRGHYRIDRQDLDRLMMDHKIDFPKTIKLIKNKLAG